MDSSGWQDFEACLDQVPQLAQVREDDDIAVIRHCCYVSDPPVPLSVMRKLIQMNPSLLRERFNEVIDQEVAGEGCFRMRKNVSVLILYIRAPSCVIDGWEVDFEICRLLVEAEPKLLFYHDDQGDTGKKALLWKFPEEEKNLLEDLGKNADLRALEKEVKEQEEKEKHDDEDY